jgi:helix-turn-helix protein
MAAMSTTHLNQAELARRWSISPRTLERWRWLGQGPRYIKIGGRVVYRLKEIEAFEAQQTRASTAETMKPPLVVGST